jgi:hypothetical protein
MATDTKELRRICEAAKPYSGGYPSSWAWLGARFGSDYLPSVAAYLTAAIQSLPALVDELDAARAEIDRLRGLVREYAEASDDWSVGIVGSGDRLMRATKLVYAAGKEIAP